ncbi:MAG: HD domain-containing protein [Candidatus Chisholmbacteria bacterium]|nr:HD domain-containing protein [Candidatus Chisholmbacteria bacterium]
MKSPLLFPEEKVLQEVILPDLDKGRKGFDRLHTEAVVHWMKKICESVPLLEERVLVTAAYAHDWGYFGMFPKRTTLDTVTARKEAHARIGAKKIGALLRTRLKKVFSEQEIKRIQHLVFVHDKLGELSADDEIAIMEADTLGALDTTIVRPTYSAEDNKRYIDEQVLKLRRPLFRHKLAIEVFEEVLERRREFYRRKASKS